MPGVANLSLRPREKTRNPQQKVEGLPLLLQPKFSKSNNIFHAVTNFPLKPREEKRNPQEGLPQSKLAPQKVEGLELLEQHKLPKSKNILHAVTILSPNINKRKNNPQEGFPQSEKNALAPQAIVDVSLSYGDMQNSITIIKSVSDNIQDDSILRPLNNVKLLSSEQAVAIREEAKNRYNEFYKKNSSEIYALREYFGLETIQNDNVEYEDSILQGEDRILFGRMCRLNTEIWAAEAELEKTLNHICQNIEPQTYPPFPPKPEVPSEKVPQISLLTEQLDEHYRRGGRELGIDVCLDITSVRDKSRGIVPLNR